MKKTKLQKLKKKLPVVDIQYKPFYPERINEFLLLEDNCKIKSVHFFINKYKTSLFMLWFNSLKKEELHRFLLDASNMNLIILIEMICLKI